MMGNTARRAQSSPARHSQKRVEPVDRRDPGDMFIEQEIASDRRSERWLWVKAAVALALVGCLIVVRQVFFA